MSFYRLFLLILILGLKLDIHAYCQSKSKFDFSYQSYTIPGNLEKPFVTNFLVEEGDYVCLDVGGKVTVGFWLGSTVASGIPNTETSVYNKYSSVNHGTLIWEINGQKGNIKLLNAETSPIRSYMTSFDMKGDFFISDRKGFLTFDINDMEPENNSGEYQVNVYKISYNNHFGRNKYNFCPLTIPTLEGDDYKDLFGNIWVKELPTSWYYHGINDSFSGTGKLSGCQCVYDLGDLLIGDEKDRGNNQGTFDFGFQVTGGQFDDPSAKRLHLILDMLPHDLWSDRLKGTNTMRYSPTQFLLK